MTERYHSVTSKWKTSKREAVLRRWCSHLQAFWPLFLFNRCSSYKNKITEALCRPCGIWLSGPQSVFFFFKGLHQRCALFIFVYLLCKGPDLPFKNLTGYVSNSTWRNPFSTSRDMLNGSLALNVFPQVLQNNFHFKGL